MFCDRLNAKSSTFHDDGDRVARRRESSGNRCCFLFFLKEPHSLKVVQFRAADFPLHPYEYTRMTPERSASYAVGNVQERHQTVELGETPLVQNERAAELDQQSGLSTHSCLIR